MSTKALMEAYMDTVKIDPRRDVGFKRASEHVFVLFFRS
jgi:hypothetical protein